LPGGVVGKASQHAPTMVSQINTISKTGIYTAGGFGDGMPAPLGGLRRRAGTSVPAKGSTIEAYEDWDNLLRLQGPKA
jgi:hypothetical protein